ncbi:metallophosphoesterase [Micromonospora sp. NPDC048935]|uniref:metallophosphoesterase n=1 Tax=Micromonospora sp. NPDC048935 TaxID=3364262 RepID=UPI003717D3B8
MKLKTLFVIMPFGIRPLEDGTEHDFDAFYLRILKPIAQDAGFDVLRVDEVVQAGNVTHQAMQSLYQADLVVADVSVPNSNVYYELGVRQALSSGGTILVAAAGTILPFDISNQRIHFYERDFAADTVFAERYRDALGVSFRPANNPVHNALSALGVAPDPQSSRAAFEREFDAKLSRADRDEQLVALWSWTRQFPNVPTSALLALAERLAKVEDWARAAEVLQAAFPAAQGDYEVHRQRGFYLRMSGDFQGGADELEQALRLNPNDPETLGILGGTAKRQNRYADALDYYSRASRIAPGSLYLRVAYAGMLILSEPARLAEAQRLYDELRTFVDDTETLVGDYWADLVSAEAHFVLGDFDSGIRRAEDAIRNGASPAAAGSTAEQIRMLGAAGVHPAEAAEFARWLTQAARARARGVATVEPFAPSRRPHLIFHISDVHFGPSGLKDSTPAVASMHRFNPDQNTLPLYEELADEFLAAMKREKCAARDVTIVVSGDMAYTGQPAELAMVHDFLAALCAAVGLDHGQVVLVPGNHDIDWTAPKHDLGRRFDNYLSFVRKFYGKQRFQELFPLVTWNFEIGDERPEPNQLIYFSRQGPCTFVGLNSCIFEDDQNHYGYVGLRQLNAVQKWLRDNAAGGDADDDGIRVAVMHHHLHPYPEALGPARTASNIVTDMSTVRDAGIVEQRLSRMGFSLLLHGHKHKPQLRETSVLNREESTVHVGRSLIVSGCGSTGVAESGLEHNQSNHFAILKVLRNRREPGADFLQVEWREMALQAGAEWVSSARWIIKG